jgi:hypothetical protein
MSLRAATLRRLVAASLLAMAFVVMASVFSPDRSQAGNSTNSRNEAGGRELGAERESQTSDAHAGLHSLGSIETSGHLVQIYCTEIGPRYTVFDRLTNRELGTLLTVEQVNQSYPELHLSDADFSASSDLGPLMLADPIESP